MHELNSYEIACGFIILGLGIMFIIALIAAGLKIAADARVEEVEQSVQRRAERIARELVRERLNGCRIQVTQKIEVVEDDLKGGTK